MQRRGMLVLPAFAACALAADAAAQSVLHQIPAPPGAESFGWAVAIVGDVNGDGLADLAVGDPLPDFPSTLAGRATVHSGLDGSVLLTIVGSSFGDTLGWSLDAAGDLDGDGRADVLVGIPQYFCDCAHAGLARVYSGRDGSVLLTLDPPLAVGEANSGWSVSGAGDVDGDGLPDQVVGAPHAWLNFIEKGSASLHSGADGSALHTFFGDATHDLFGWSVDGAGDVDGDGVPDLIVGAPQNSMPASGPGYAKVFSGADGSLIHLFVGDALGQGFGQTVAGAGDVDRDGFADLIVGSPDDGGAGRAVVLSGQDGSVLHSHQGAVAGDRFGFACTGLGDIDNDGFADYAIGAPGQPGSAGVHGAVDVCSGRLGRVLYRLDSTASSSSGYGFALDGGGDVDGDGLPDLLVGQPSSTEGVVGATALTLVPEGLLSYGAGTAGCAGQQLLLGNSVPTPGNIGFRLTCNHAPPLGAGLAVLTNAPDIHGSDPFGLGILLHVDPLAASLMLMFPMTGDPLGFSSASVPVPANPGLVGQTFFAQGVWNWGGSCGLTPLDLSTSAGLSITIQAP